MEKKKLTNEQMSSLFTSAIILVIGILFCCSRAMGVTGTSWLIGISLAVTGITFLVNAVIQHQSMLNSTGLLGSALLAFGAMFTVQDLAQIIFNYIPFLLIIVGAVIVIDAFLRKFAKKEISTSNCVFQLLVGIVILILGFCLKFVVSFAEFASLVLGLIIIAYSLIEIVNVFVNKKESNEVIIEEKKTNTRGKK